MAMLRRGAIMVLGGGLMLSGASLGFAAPTTVKKAAPAKPAAKDDDAAESGAASDEAAADPVFKPLPKPQPKAKPGASKAPSDEAAAGKDSYRPPNDQPPSWFMPASDQEKKRSDIGIPIVSFLLPGFGQWLNGDFTSGAVYSGAALAGYIYAGQVSANDHLAHQHDVMKQRARDHGVDEQNALAQKDIAERKYTLGGLVAQGAGGISLYHSFRTAVATRRAAGEYTFLARDETPMELFAAPFNFAYLARPTTYIPLAIGATIAAIQSRQKPDKDSVRSRYNGADALFTTSFSYNAGTHEEAIFRGWLMPVAREYGANDTWSNVIQSLLFAAAHLNINSTPLPQLLLGYDLGYVSQKNHWALSEGVFIHVWWDVMAFYAQYQFDWKCAKQNRVNMPKPVLWAPPLEWHF